MNSQILCSLLSVRIPPAQFQVHGDVVVFMDAQYDTPANQAIVADVVANYATLAPAHTSASEKAIVLAQARELRDKIFSRLNGIQQDLEWNRFKCVLADAQAIPQIDGIVAAKAALKDITTYPTVAAAVTGAETTAALKARYAQLVPALYAASQYAYTAFNGLDV